MNSKVNTLYEYIKEQGKAKGFKNSGTGNSSQGKDATGSIANTVGEVIAKEQVKNGLNGNGNYFV